MSGIIQSVADNLPSAKSIYDAALMYGIVHGIYKAPAMAKRYRKWRRSERVLARKEHRNPHFLHTGKSPRDCTDGKCAML